MTDGNLIQYALASYTPDVFPGGLLEHLTPHARVATAVVPFASALFFRLVTGKSRLASYLIMGTTTWFVVNILMTPFSFGMQQDLIRIKYALFH